MPENRNTRRDRNQRALLGRADIDAHGFGTLHIAWSDLGIVRLAFEEERPPELETVPVAPLPAEWAGILARYFAGEDVDPVVLPVDLRAGTAFQQRVWQALRRIPRGRVRSYAGVAADVGRPRGMRAVGMANARNPIPIVVPCHRVVEAGNLLGGFSAGIARKIKLLELEGARVEGDRVRPGQLGLL